MLINKDVYEYILNFVDNETLVNMLSVNKKFSNDEYYLRLLIRKYPDLSKFRKDETYKKLFLRMTYYIEKLQKRYDFPYIPSPDFDPFAFYMEITANDSLPVSDEEKSWSQKLEEWWDDDNPLRDMWNEGLRYASHTADEKLMNYMLEMGAWNIDPALYNAAHRGNMKMVTYVLKLNRKKYYTEDDPWNYNNALSSSCTGSQYEMVKFFVEKGANNFDNALLHAGYGKNIDIMKFLIEKGASTIHSNKNILTTFLFYII